MSSNIDYAIILAGGKGERLRPHTDNKPKPMVEVGGKPIIVYQLERLQSVGVKEVVIACSYKWEAIKEYLGNGEKLGMKISYSVETEPLGRGGGIKKAMQFLPDNWEDALVLNGDILSNSSLEDLVAQHYDKKALVTLTVVPLKSPYGIVEFNENNEVLGFREKPILPHWINAGMYVFSKEIEPLLPEVGDHETETFPKLPKEKFLVFQSEDYWRGVDTVKDLTEAEKEVVEIFGQPSVSGGIGFTLTA